jgi:hypothetical protein
VYLAKVRVFGDFSVARLILSFAFGHNHRTKRFDDLTILMKFTTFFSFYANFSIARRSFALALGENDRTKMWL